MLKSLIAAGALAVAAPLAPALADSHTSFSISVGTTPVSYHNSWRRGYRHFAINRYEAVRIAERYGLARVRDIDFEQGFWEVEGWTRRGARVEVEISARTGRVVDVDYYRRGRGYDRRGRGHRRAHEDHGVRWSMTEYERSWDRNGDVERDGDRDRDRDRDRRGDGNGDRDRDGFGHGGGFNGRNRH